MRNNLDFLHDRSNCGPKYCLNDGIHGHDLNTPQEKYLAEHGFATKEQAVAWWGKRVKLNGGGKV